MTARLETVPFPGSIRPCAIFPHPVKRRATQNRRVFRNLFIHAWGRFIYMRSQALKLAPTGNWVFDEEDDNPVVHSLSVTLSNHTILSTQPYNYPCPKDHL
jgi:hypothetical protein